MEPKKRRTSIEDVFLYTLPMHSDSRGVFAEAFRKEWVEREYESDLQVNCSHSRAGVIRGMHYHLRQTDYWILASGRIRAVLVDVRPFKKTMGVVETIELDAGRPESLWIPPGVAHGYAALESASLVYLVNRYFTGEDEHGLAWDDPDLGIDWGIEDPILSKRDRTNPPLADLDRSEIERALTP